MTKFRTVQEIEIDFDYNLEYFEKNFAHKVDKITKCIFRTMIRFLKKEEYKSAISYWYSEEKGWCNNDSKLDYPRGGYMELWISSRETGSQVNVYKESRMEAIPMRELIYKLKHGLLESVE